MCSLIIVFNLVLGLDLDWFGPCFEIGFGHDSGHGVGLELLLILDSLLNW